jgi:hypothetical protein
VYQIINLPREFVNPPLYLLRQESKPKELAQRMALALRPTLRGSVQIGYQPVPQRPQPKPAPKRVAVMTPLAARAVGPAGRSVQVVMGQPIIRITNALPMKMMKLVKRPLTPRRLPIRAGLPLVRMLEHGPADGDYAQEIMQSGQASRALDRMDY